MTLDDAVRAIPEILERQERIEDQLYRLNSILSQQHVTPPRKYLTADEAADYLNIAIGTLYNLHKQGKIPQAGSRRYDIADLDEYMQAAKDGKNQRKDVS